MNQKTHTAITLLMLTVTILAGCEKEPPRPQAVTMNMGTIGEATGLIEEMKQRTEKINQMFSEEIKALSIKQRKEIYAKRNSLGDNPSEEDEQEIQTLEGQLKKQLIEFRKEGQATKAKEINEIRQSYINRIMYVAEMIANEQGASIILKANGVFWSDSSVDITDEVIERLSGSKAPQPADQAATDI